MLCVMGWLMPTFPLGVRDRRETTYFRTAISNSNSEPGIETDEGDW